MRVSQVGLKVAFPLIFKRFCGISPVVMGGMD